MILEQRTRDIEGMTGQLRGFELGQFLGDWEDEESWNPIPWTMPSDSLPSAAESSRRPEGRVLSFSSTSAADADSTTNVSLAKLMADSGVKPKMKMLYVSDYVEPRTRLMKTQKLYQDMSAILPSWEVELALSEGPFEDDEESDRILTKERRKWRLKNCCWRQRRTC